MTADTAVPYDRMSTTSSNLIDPTKCCCCIPLRIGCFIIGYINLIYNTIQTLCLISMTTIIGVETHGFDHFNTERPPTPDEVPTLEAMNDVLVRQGKILIFMCCVNVAWWLINVACLVGLHKRQPGPIKVYVRFASARLVFAMAGFIYLVVIAGHGDSRRIISYTIDIILTAYFILLYYIYAARLERSIQEENAMEAQYAPEPVNPTTEISHIYPAKLDTKHLISA